MTFASYIAIGDSFTEGYGDERPDGTPRGWADFVAQGLAAASSDTVSYANLAIRGRKLAPIVTDQLNAALAQHPALLSLNGGGNDLMRPRVRIRSIADQLVDAARRAAAAGTHVVLASGANPSRHIPLGGLLQRRGDELADAVKARLPIEGVTFVDNWSDRELAELKYWSIDQLHLNAAGHARVAGNVLRGLGVHVPEFDATELDGPRPGATTYWREYVVPWIGRRLTGRSSGDNRLPKIAMLAPVEPNQPAGGG
jgi:lysophospholipase L1-like esterase